MIDNKTTVSEVTVKKEKASLLSKVILISAILFISLLIIFGFQNNDPLALKFLTWEFETTIIGMILYVLLVGAAIAAVVTLRLLAKKNKEMKSLNKYIKELENKKT